MARKEGSVVVGHLLGKGYVIAVRVRVIQILAATDNRRSVAAAATPTDLRLHLHLSPTALKANNSTRHHHHDNTANKYSFWLRYTIEGSIFPQDKRLLPQHFSNYLTIIGCHFVSHSDPMVNDEDFSKFDLASFLVNFIILVLIEQENSWLDISFKLV